MNDGHALKGSGLCAPVEEIGIRDAAAAAVRQIKNAVVVSHLGKACEEGSFGDGEDRRIHADADGENGNGDSREPRAFAESAKRIDEVTQE